MFFDETEPYGSLQNHVFPPIKEALNSQNPNEILSALLILKGVFTVTPQEGVIAVRFNEISQELAICSNSLISQLKGAFQNQNL